MKIREFLAKNKECNCCKFFKPKTMFGRRYKDPEKTDLEPICKPCKSAKRRAYYKANKEHELERNKRNYVKRKSSK